MTTTKHRFSTSINILRDWDSGVNYIPTPNSRIVFNQILNNALLSSRSFNIIGAYGSGKSSFLVAFQKSLSGKKNYFSDSIGLIKQFPDFEYLPIIGSFDSLTKAVAESIGLDSKLNYRTQDVIKALDKHYQVLNKKGKGLAIFIDEFGKFLEYASKHNPESELYFIQQLAEYVNDPDKNLLLINTLHQDFNTYANDLSKAQRNEWDKVKGRMKEITFNEPVEQLLYLAAERISEKFKGKHKADKNFQKLFGSIKESKAFPLKDYLNTEFAAKLFPFDILSTAVLTLALQKYGQNERSLFSFLESSDPLSLSDFNHQEENYYSIAKVHDYLSHNFYSFLYSRSNPHFTQWMSIKRALERVEGLPDESTHESALALIKTVGLLNIFASASAKLDSSFLESYVKSTGVMKNPEAALKQLETFKLIRYVNHNFKYVLFEGTDVDIELEIDKAGNLVEKISDVVNSLNEYFEFPFIQAKQVFYELGTPRLFQFKLSEKPIDLIPEGEVDGFINLIFSEGISEAEACKASSKCEEAILYGYYTNTNEIKKLLFEIRKIKKVINDNAQDKVAVKELNSILDHQIRLLNHYVLGSFYSDKNVIRWYYKGELVSVLDRRELNKLLTHICKEVYEYTPVYKNEMINKTKLSSQISSARRTLMNLLIDNSVEAELGFEADKFPPEKTIYLSLIKATGIHNKFNHGYSLGMPKVESFGPLWEVCINFLNSSKDAKRTVQELIDVLSVKPFKLKSGFIDFWVPLFLLIKKNDYALYDDEGYIPELSSDTIDLLLRKPTSFKVKAFDVSGPHLDLFNRYRAILNQQSEKKLTSESFIETIKPFIVFYKRDLNTYAQQTKRLSKKTIAFREAIAKSTDPEKTFFEDFPKALGYTLQGMKSRPKEAELFINEMQDCIRELRTCYDDLINRFETYLTKDLLGIEVEFPEYKDQMKIRYKRIRKHMLRDNQKSFYSRLLSELDDRRAWLNSLAQVCIGKTMDVITDEEERVLVDKLKEMVYELDNLSDISRDDMDSDHEEVLKLEVTSYVQGLKKNLIRLPKSKTEEMEKKQQEIRKLLASDKQINVFILTKLLQELLSK